MNTTGNSTIKKNI